MAAVSSLEAVKKKIKSLQEQADVAEDRAASLQRELNKETRAREAVSCLQLFKAISPQTVDGISRKSGQTTWLLGPDSYGYS